MTVVGFETWWAANNEAAAWDRTWANVSAIKEIARRAYDAGFADGEANLADEILAPSSTANPGYRPDDQPFEV